MTLCRDDRMILSYFHWIIRCSLNHLKSCQRTWSSGFTHTLVLWNSMYIFQFFNYECKEKGKGSGVWPSMVTHTQNVCSAFNPSKCTHTVVNIHPEQWAANAAVPGEQLGVRCLAQGSHLSHGIEGGESAGYSLPPHRQSLPDLRLEPTTFRLQVQLSIH